MNFFAHAGHDHAETSEASANFMNSELLYSLLAVVVFVTLFLLTKYVFKLKLSTRVALIMGYLLLIGAGMYQLAPVVSIVALASGIALALTTTLFQLAKGK